MNKFTERFYERYTREDRVRRTPRTYRKKEKDADENYLNAQAQTTPHLLRSRRTLSALLRTTLFLLGSAREEPTVVWTRPAHNKQLFFARTATLLIDVNVKVKVVSLSCPLHFLAVPVALVLRSRSSRVLPQNLFLWKLYSRWVSVAPTTSKKCVQISYFFRGKSYSYWVIEQTRSQMVRKQVVRLDSLDFLPSLA